MIYFVRDLDIWRLAPSAEPELFLPAGERRSSPGASNSSLGVQSLAVSPDGDRVAYVLARIGGSGVAEVWVASTGGTASATRLYEASAFTWVSWADGDHLVLGESATALLVIDAATGLTERVAMAVGPVPVAASRAGADWLLGPFTREGAIRVGSRDALREIVRGVGPARSPDGARVAYFQDETIRLVRSDGTGDHVLVDLSPLGRRDRHFAANCGGQLACSYRPPALSWQVAP